MTIHELRPCSDICDSWQCDWSQADLWLNNIDDVDLCMSYYVAASP